MSGRQPATRRPDGPGTATPGTQTGLRDRFSSRDGARVRSSAWTMRRSAELPIGWHVKIVSVRPGCWSMIHIAVLGTTSMLVTRVVVRAGRVGQHDVVAGGELGVAQERLGVAGAVPGEHDVAPGAERGGPGPVRGTGVDDHLLDALVHGLVETRSSGSGCDRRPRGHGARSGRERGRHGERRRGRRVRSRPGLGRDGGVGRRDDRGNGAATGWSTATALRSGAVAGDPAAIGTTKALVTPSATKRPTAIRRRTDPSVPANPMDMGSADRRPTCSVGESPRNHRLPSRSRRRPPTPRRAGTAPRSAPGAPSSSPPSPIRARTRECAPPPSARSCATARGADARRAWAAAVADPDADVRRRGAAELAPRDRPPAASLLGAPCRPRTARARGRVLGGGRGRRSGADGAAVVAAVIESATHADPLVREAAVAALGALGDPRGRPAVLAGARTDPRCGAAPCSPRGVRRTGGGGRARGRAEDPDWQTRQAAEDLAIDQAD